MGRERIKQIDGYGKYFISDTGRVINSRDKEKAQQISSHGYYKVDLYKNGNRTSERVHRLVAKAYVYNDDPLNKTDVNHKDGNKLNNNFENLEWCTKSENMQHAYNTGLAKPHPSYGMRGHKNPNAGRKGRKVRIVETNEIFDSVKDCAIAVCGSDRRICDCLNHKQKTHMNYHYESI